MEKSKGEDKYGFKSIKVRWKTYMRLRKYKIKMESEALERGDDARYSMDRLINAMLDLIETAFAPVEDEEEC